MGRAGFGGRRPQSGHLKLLRGNPGRRPIDDQVDIEPGLPDCPADLVGYAREVYLAEGPELERRGIVTPLDVGIFAAFCRVKGRMRWIGEALEKLPGLTYMRPHYSMDGKLLWEEPRPHPLVVQERQLVGLLRLLQVELGLTLMARPRIRPARQAPPASKWDGLLPSLKSSAGTRTERRHSNSPVRPSSAMRPRTRNARGGLP